MDGKFDGNSRGQTMGQKYDILSLFIGINNDIMTLALLLNRSGISIYTCILICAVKKNIFLTLQKCVNFSENFTSKFMIQF